MNGVVGAATGGVGLACQGLKVGGQVAISAASGSALSGAQKVVDNAINDRPLDEGLGTALVCGAAAGGAGAGLAAGASSIKALNNPGL